MRLLITQDMPKAMLRSFFEKCTQPSELPSSARAMATHMQVARDNDGNVLGLINRYAKPKTRYPAEKPKRESVTVKNYGSDFADKRAAIFAD